MRQNTQALQTIMIMVVISKLIQRRLSLSDGWNPLLSHIRSDCRGMGQDGNRYRTPLSIRALWQSQLTQHFV